MEDALNSAQQYLDPIRVIVAGAAGRMGRAVVAAVADCREMELVAAVDRSENGRDTGEVVGVGALGVEIQSSLTDAIESAKPHVMVDFTVHESALANIETALKAGVAPVVGTTGFTADDLSRVARLSIDAGVGCLIAPNFAIGAVLMMEFAAQAARHLPDVEIIELHHEKKLDAPSGTAMLTAQKIAAARSGSPKGSPAGEVQKAPGARGGDVEGIHVHSVRLPGFVAHQEVIFGGIGQTLTIRHDSTDRTSFMPGVLLAIRSVRSLKGLVIGLEHLLFGG